MGFYARYVDWAFTTPLQLIDLLGFGMLMFAPIVYYLLVDLKESAKGLGKDAEGVYNKISMLTAITWACYPVVWLFAEGSNKLSADTEAYAYTFLDILSKSVFGFIIISGRNALEAGDSDIAPISGQQSVHGPHGSGMDLLFSLARVVGAGRRAMKSASSNQYT